MSNLREGSPTRYMRSLSLAAGVAAGLLGLLVLIGGLFDLTLLKSVRSDWVPMKVNTALGVMLAGAALTLRCLPRSARWRQWLGRCCALVVAVIGLTTLTQYVFGWDLRIDGLLLPASAAVDLNPDAFRMSAISAVNLSFLGLAVLLLGSATALSQVLALLVGFLALLGLEAYMYGGAALSETPGYGSIAIHTSVAFLLLAGGILAARPDQGIVKVTGGATGAGSMALRLLPAAIFLPPILGWLRLQGERAGLYGTELGLILFAISNVLLLVALVLWTARMLYAAQQELSESEERLCLALAAANQGLFDINIQTGESVVSPEYAHMLGHDAAEFRETYATWRERLHPDDREDACRAYEEYADGRRDEHRIQFRQRTKSGDWRWILSVGRLVSRSADGRPLRILGTQTDITDRKQVEEALQASESRYRLVLDHVDEVVYMVSMAAGSPFAGTVDFVSSRVSGMLGHEPDDFLTDSTLWFKSLHPEDIPAIDETTRAILSRKTAGTRIYRIRHETGAEYRWIEDRVVPRMDDSGNVTGWFGVARDITEGKRAEQVRHELWRRLLRLQDEERRRIARELHDTTAQYLAALNMNLVLLEKAVPSDDARCGRLLADCQQLADHSAQEIRTLSYLLHPPLLDEFGLVRAMRDYAEGFSQRSGIRVELDAPGDLCRFPEEIEMALFRVLQESLGNVHRHSGSPVARIRLARNDTQLCLEIRDQGRGLPADLLDAEGSLGAAAGVGLLGMRERIRQLGGSLELETGLPGALVRVIIPIKESVR